MRLTSSRVEQPRHAAAGVPTFTRQPTRSVRRLDGRALPQALRRVFAVEQPQRFDEQAAQRGDGFFVVVADVGAAALHEAEVGLAGAQQFKVVGRTFEGSSSTVMP
jgi:hypothetical protein